MSHNYDNGTWTYHASKCRAPACRCDAPCDDMGGTYTCHDCGKEPGDCICPRCEWCGTLDAECDCEADDA